MNSKLELIKGLNCKLGYKFYVVGTKLKKFQN